MFQIRNDIEVPSQANKKPGPRSLYPLGEMQVGSVFFVPIAEGETAKVVINRLKTKTWQWRKRNQLQQIRFAVLEHENPADGTPSIGVWRVA